MTKMSNDVEIQSVDETYCHYEKSVVSHGIVRPNNSRLKWYDIARKDRSISASTRQLAESFIDDQAILTGVPGNNELGFILLHRCGEDFYFLLLCTWKNSNELWETVCYFDPENMEDFAPFPQETLHKGTFCVWEMRVVAQETQVWTKYLMSLRTPEDVQAYPNSSVPAD